MIKLPKEVNSIVNALAKAGKTAYCTGDCVRQYLAGVDPVDWDIAVAGSFAEIQGMFSGAEVLKDSKDTLRFDYTKGDNFGVEVEKEGTSEEEESQEPIIDLHVVENVEEYLKEADFTINAIGDSTSSGQLDPAGGKSDFSKKLIRTVKDPKVAFAEKPALMLRAISLAAEMDFDLAKTVYDGILANGDKLGSISVGRIREEFCTMMGCGGAGKALKLLASCDMMRIILGPNVTSLTRREISDIEEMAEKVHKTNNVFERRLGLFYLCLGKKKARAAIEYMNYDDELKQHLLDAVNEIETVFFLTNEIKFKDFLARFTWERYDYVHYISKAQLLVYEGPSTRVEGRNYMMNEFKRRRDPIFIEDLAITGKDLEEAGICKDEEDVHNMLLMLTDVVHRDTSMNTERKLLDKAKYFKKHKLAAAFRNVSWRVQ